MQRHTHKRERTCRKNISTLLYDVAAVEVCNGSAPMYEYVYDIYGMVWLTVTLTGDAEQCAIQTAYTRA